MIKNKNHPKKGSVITVEPIKNLKDINAIKKLVNESPRNYLLFVMGINNGLRAGDLLKLKVKDVRYLKPGQTITIRESKTGKLNILMVNKSVHKAIQNYIEQLKPDDDDYLFASYKTKKPIKVQSLNNLIKLWTKSINIKGNYGSHSLRKTFGYVQRTEYKVGFEILAKRFNHSSPAITMRYLGLSNEEVNHVLMNEI